MNRLKTLFISIALFILMLSQAYAWESVKFQGVADLVNQHIDGDLLIDNEKIMGLQFIKNNPNSFDCLVQIDHLRFKNTDFTTQFNSELQIESGKENPSFGIRGKIKSQYSLINYKPISEMKGNFFFQDGRFTISSLDFKSLMIKGFVDLNSSLKYGFDVKINQFELNDILSFWMPKKTYDSQGLIDGTLRVDGDLKQLFAKGQLKIHEGYIRKFNFQGIDLDVMGYYPFMQIANSSITTDDGLLYSLSGNFDLSKKDGYKRQIEELTIAPIIAKTDSTVEWTLKKNQDANGTSRTLKYILRKENVTNNIPNTSDEGLMGVEQRVQF